MRIHYRFCFILSLAVSPCWGLSAWSHLSGKLFSDRNCQERVQGLTETPIVLTDALLQSFLPLPPGKEASSETTDGWSSDLLLKIISELEQNVGLACQLPESLTKIVSHLKIKFLGRLGFGREWSPEDRELLFRAFSVEQRYIPDLRKKKEALEKKPTTALGWVKAIYDQEVAVVGGTVVLAKHRESFSQWDTFLKKACPAKTECPFYTPKLLYRVLVAEKDGVGAYLPELSTLILSEKALREPTLLHALVIFHELAHLAIHKHRLLDPKFGVATFAAYSGWKKKQGRWALSVTQNVPREDALSQMAVGSAFSFLPDPVVTPVEKTKDGFVLARSYRESQKRNDLEEDMADHIAMAQVVPERFCWKGRALAPQKFAWVRKNFSPGVGLPSCLRQ